MAVTAADEPPSPSNTAGTSIGRPRYALAAVGAPDVPPPSLQNAAEKIRPISTNAATRLDETERITFSAVAALQTKPPLLKLVPLPFFVGDSAVATDLVISKDDMACGSGTSPFESTSVLSVDDACALSISATAVAAAAAVTM